MVYLRKDKIVSITNDVGVGQLDRSEDLGFDKSLSHIQEHFNKSISLSAKLFVTDVSGESVWDVFQTALREQGGPEAASI